MPLRAPHFVFFAVSIGLAIDGVLEFVEALPNFSSISDSTRGFTAMLLAWAVLVGGVLVSKAGLKTPTVSRGWALAAGRFTLLLESLSPVGAMTPATSSPDRN